MKLKYWFPNLHVMNRTTFKDAAKFLSGWNEGFDILAVDIERAGDNAGMYSKCGYV